MIDFLLDKIQQKISEKLIHESISGELRLYKYTRKAVYESAWDEVTMQTRGLILNVKTNEIVARPFKKFFNINENEITKFENLPWSDGYEVYAKLDGSLGILYRQDGILKIATAGSFESDQAKWATKFLYEKFENKIHLIPNEMTILFEIIYPQNRIVVDYGQKENIVVLAAFNRLMDAEYDRSEVEHICESIGFEIVPLCNETIDSLIEQTKIITDDCEGWVIRFKNGLRVKVKTLDYFRRAKIIANITPLEFWRNMKNGEVEQSLLETIPEEFAKLRNTIEKTLIEQYRNIKKEMMEEARIVVAQDLSNMEEIAYYIQTQTKHKNALFSLVKNPIANMDKYIMKIIRPKNNES